MNKQIQELIDEPRLRWSWVVFGKPRDEWDEFDLQGIRVELNLQDLWIGLYWKRKSKHVIHQRWRYDCYICILPFLPIHIWWTQRSWKVILRIAKEKWIRGTNDDSIKESE